MKIKALVVAILAAASAPSFAVSPITAVGEIGSTNAVVELNGSGATAVDKQLASLLKNDVCNGQPFLTFTGTGAAVNHFAYACTYTIPAPVNTTVDLVVRKNSAGGSFNGVGPVANAATSEEQLDFSTCSLISGTDYSCTGVTVAPHPVVDWGVSDVEPALWAKLGNSFPNTLDAKSMNLNTFGVPVTIALRNALQVAQGFVPGSDAEDQQPNLSRSQVASLLQGAIPSWDQFFIGNVPITAAAGVTPPAFNKVQVCRRTKESGTQAQADVFFNNSPCGSTSKTLADNTAFSTTTNPASVITNLNPAPATRAAIHEMESSGNLSGCLDQLQGANMWAIGISTVERKSNFWRFVKIDGAAPTLKNVADNNYLDVFSSSMQWRTAAFPSQNAEKKAVLNKIRDDASKASILAVINGGLSQANMGPVGLLALPWKPTSLLNPVFSVANPVATASREGPTGAAAPDSCKTPVIVKNSVISKPL